MEVDYDWLQSGSVVAKVTRFSSVDSLEKRRNIHLAQLLGVISVNCDDLVLSRWRIAEESHESQHREEKLREHRAG